MQNEANSFDDKIRESVSNYSFPFNDAHWQAMQGRLPLVVPVPWWKTWQAAAAVIAILLISNIISLYFLSLKTTQTPIVVQYIPVYDDTLNVFKPTPISTSSVAFAQKVETQNSLESNGNTAFATSALSENNSIERSQLASNKEAVKQYRRALNSRKMADFAANNSSKKIEQKEEIALLNKQLKNIETTITEKPTEAKNAAIVEASAPKIAAISLAVDSMKSAKISSKDSVLHFPKKEISRWLVSVYFANEMINWPKVHSRYEKGSVIGGKISYQLNRVIGIETGLLLARSNYTAVRTAAPPVTFYPTLLNPAELSALTVNQQHWQIPVQVQCKVLKYKKATLIASAGAWLRRSVIKTENNYTSVESVNSADSALVGVQTRDISVEHTASTQKLFNGGTNISVGISCELNPKVSFQIAPYWQKTLTQKQQVQGQSFGIGASIGLKL